MKKFLFYILILIILVGPFVLVEKVSAAGGACSIPTYNGDREGCETAGGDWVAASATPPGGTPAPSKYILLAPLPDGNGGKMTSFDPGTTTGDNTALGRYLNLMIKLLIGLSAVMAVVMIVIGGMEYMTSELISSKEAGKERIKGAILGLLLALGAYTLLFTINPKLLDTKLESLTDATVTVTTNSAYVKPVSASANCVVAPTGNSCAPRNLSAFGSLAENASRICMVESGGNAAQISGTDRCSGGTGFSYGLFQINLIANGASIRTPSGESCGNLFEREDGSPISGSNYINPPGSSLYNCKAKLDQATRLSACAAALQNPVENIRIAAALNQARPGLQDWRYSDQLACSAAFK